MLFCYRTTAMATLKPSPIGNVLGAARAEVDTLLARAFIETPAYRALIQNTDYNFVVGRRGTGKSALFQKVREYFVGTGSVLVVADAPQEHHVIELQTLLVGAVGLDYRMLRAISRLIWRTQLLIEVLVRMRRHYRFFRSAEHTAVLAYIDQHKGLVEAPSSARPVMLVRAVLKDAASCVEIAPRLAAFFETDRLQQLIAAGLGNIGDRSMVLYDGLDEGWIPDVPATALLGGLAMAAADLTDRKTGVNPILFVRDNIFRALAELDSDFTRHIEGHTLRLHWDEDSLLYFVAQRLRVAFGIEGIESDIKVWNRFAHRALQERDGFLACLHYTLYRPRDVIVLLNDAYASASRDGRDGIVESDIELSARRISQHRLDDLLKEYETVFPGLTLFVNQFRARPTQETVGTVVSMLNDATERADFSNPTARDFGIFESGSEIFSALYSVGFVGVQENGGVSYAFCHDGTASTLASVEPTRSVMVHPCYWKALDLRGDTPPEGVMIKINDEYEARPSEELMNIRSSLLGEIYGALPRLPLGSDGSKQFEEWALRTAKVLFAGKISNFQLKPNSGATQQRDVVGTNLAADGFWRRIRDDYRTRQVIFEIKNYEELTPDDFRQLVSYLSGEYGEFGIIVSRGRTENPSEPEKAWIRTMWSEQRKIVMIVPAESLARCVSKLRSPRKYDYTEDFLNKRMDHLVRSYLNIPMGKKFRKKKS